MGNCFALVSAIINVGGGFFVDANLPERHNECFGYYGYDYRKGDCLRVKTGVWNAEKKKYGKKCAWRLINGARHCVERNLCLGISTKKKCHQKKKRRACTWKQDRPSPRKTRKLRTKGGFCETAKSGKRYYK